MPTTSQGFNKIFPQFKDWLETKPFESNTTTAYLYSIDKFLVYLESFEIYDLNSVGMELLMKFAYIKGGGDSYAPKTTKLRLAALNLFLAWAYEQRYVHDNLVIAKRKKELIPNLATQKKAAPTTTIFFLFPEEQNKLLDITDTGFIGVRNKSLMALILASGLLSRDVIKLKSDALDLCNGYVSLDIYTGGTILGLKKTPLDLTICQQSCHAWLRKRSEVFKSDLRGYLFTTTKGEPLTQRALHKIVAKHLSRAGIKRMYNGPDLLRQSAICNMLRNGKTMEEIQYITGIKTVATIEKYRNYLKAPKELQQA